ncbi:MAG: hypothetical protein A2117_01410 [Candidatus Wildermuthbacteria bacterium GWA2_46_15]|uniref:Uncharacterized protein n=1 Tax=Candidatus Wildermuthbacteria bacterium GWA2_46_15 TaxID=1802443 RepID=A0A1G2QQ48_9BACT|nr:MAG: hypothetical protein A2117_01410 [Candidatus Wildermuthbacteria bacterium GWA2_46_15]
MPINPKLVDLVAQHDWDAEYAHYIGGLNFENEEIRALAMMMVGLDTQEERLALWAEMGAIPNFAAAIGQDEDDNPIPHQDIVNLANPYYVGFGNPNAEILIIGKEKAFDLVSRETPGNNGRNYIDKLFMESINNYFDWKSIISHKYNSAHEFCAVYPFKNGFYTHRYQQNQVFVTPGARHTHTWGVCERLINYVTGNNYRYERDVDDYPNSFYSKCFTTEINHMPSKYSPGGDLALDPRWPHRRSFLCNDRGFPGFDLYSKFLKTFPITVMGAKDYAAHINMNHLFNDVHVQRQQAFLSPQRWGPLPQRRRLARQSVDFYEGTGRLVAVIGQLSGRNRNLNDNTNTPPRDPLKNLAAAINYYKQHGHINIPALVAQGVIYL